MPVFKPLAGTPCVIDGELVRYADVDVDALGRPEIVTAHKLSRFILMSGKPNAGHLS